MRRFALILGSVLLASSCADITEIQDGRALGPLVTIKDLFTSCYLLETNDDVVLFDSCWQPGTLESALDRRGLSPSDVTHVLLTHGHQDHSAGLSILPNAQVLAIADEQTTLDEYSEDGQIDQAIADGEILSFGEHTVHVLSVRGHTAGSAVYVTGGVVLLGDAALGKANGEIDTVPEDRSDDPQLARESLAQLDERIEALGVNVDFLAPSHSGAADGLAPLRDFAP